MTRKQLIQISAAVIMFAVTIGLVARYGVGRRRTTEAAPQRIYFYDLGTGQLFADDAAALPPIAAPSGAGNGVGAVVYACGACSEPQLRIGYLERMSDEGKQAHARLRELSASGADTPSHLVELVDRERYVAPPPSPDEVQTPQWASLASPQGRQIVERFWTACGDNTRPIRCNPP